METLISRIPFIILIFGFSIFERFLHFHINLTNHPLVNLILNL